MEQLFAVRVLVHYHDKSNVDHAAVRRLLAAAAVDSLTLLLADGTSVPLATYIQINPNERKPIADVATSNGSALTQVASVFMLAEARAAADALPSSPHELETACSALERLLGCLATKRPQLPVRDIKQSARVKFGTAARRRAVHRLSRSGSAANQVSILKAVNTVLRLCDVATHCLAVVSRQSVSSKSSCETAVALSTRLLTLAASLYEVQKVDTTPALSFFSSNSLRTALVAGAMHLGAIAVEHLEIEPMPWVHIANRIVMSDSTSAAPKTSVLSALFGGMIKAAKRYEANERDAKAAEGALCLLSTLHVVLETDIVRESQGSSNAQSVEPRQSTTGNQPHPPNINPAIALGAGAISQAARSFLGERVVSAEEDGDEGRIAARTVYQACEEYAERAGEGDGIMGLLTRLFASAGRQCRLESAEEPVVSISEGTLLGQPDESDASSEGSHLRPDSPPFLIDVFDQRSNVGFGASATVGSASETGLDHAERIELHREIGALALDTLAHWVSRSESFPRYVEHDITTFSLNICRSASFFSLGNTSASYDLRAAMVDFGSLLGPLLLPEVSSLLDEERETRWSALIADLVSSCYRMNPILNSILSFSSDAIVVKSLLHTFLERYRDDDACLDFNPEGTNKLPVESLLNLILSLITEANSLEMVEIIVQAFKKPQERDIFEASISHRTSCLILLGHTVHVALGIPSGIDTARITFAALYNRDVDGTVDPVFPQQGSEVEVRKRVFASSSCPLQRLERLKTYLSGIPSIIDRLCFQKAHGSWDFLATKAAISREEVDIIRSGGRGTRSERLYYHVFWACGLMHKSMSTLSRVCDFSFNGLVSANGDPRQLPLCTPFVCMKALESQMLNKHIRDSLIARKQGSVTLLYTAECLALTHPQTGVFADELDAFAHHSLSSLLISIVKNVMSIASDCTFHDISSNFDALQRSFRKGFTVGMGDATATDKVEQREVSSQLNREQAGLAFLQMAMEYMRYVGTRELGQLLGKVMASVVGTLSYLTRRQLEDAKYLLFDVADILLFFPECFTCLGRSSFRFIQQLVIAAFPVKGKSANDIDKAILCISRIRGFGRIVRFSANSTSAIHLLCKFAYDSAKDSTFDNTALEASFSLGASCNEMGSEIHLLLKESSSRVLLSRVLSTLLIPEDDSAVAVSAHAQSLSLLTEACESSSHWQSSVLDGLSQIFAEDLENFSTRLVRRSVMQSATMYEGVLAIFERVVGKGNSRASSAILRRAFQATRYLFESEVDSNLESKIRLLSFAVRLSVADSRLLRNGTEVLSPPLLERELVRLIIFSLERITSILESNSRDADAKQMVLFLCGLLDCFLVGIYGQQFSFFSDHTDQSSSSKPAENKSSGNVQDECESVEESADHVDAPVHDGIDVTVNEPNAAKSSLCTYTSTGNQFVEQHWYFCYTCELAGSEGVCSVCARVCHSECELAYSKFSRFFCDCGAGSDPHHENASNPMSASEDGDGGHSNPHDSRSHSIPGQARKRRPCKCLKSSTNDEHGCSKHCEAENQEKSDTFFTQEKVGDFKLCDTLISEVRSLKRESKEEVGRGVLSIQESFEGVIKSVSSVRSLICTCLFLIKEIDGSDVNERTMLRFCDSADLNSKNPETKLDMTCSSSSQTDKLAVLSKLYKAGSVDESGGISDSAKFENESLISYSHVRNIIAIGQKSGLVEFFDAKESLNHCGGSIDKITAADYSSTSVPFEVIYLQFHPTNENLVLVMGSNNVSILSRVFEGGSCRWNHNDIELGLNEYEGSNGSNVLRSASWTESETVSVLVTTAKFVKVFDVLSDVFCPSFFAVLPEEVIPTNQSVENAAENNSMANSSGNEIIAATLVPRIEKSSLVQRVFVCVLATGGGLFGSHISHEGVDCPRLSFICNLQNCRTDGALESAVVGLLYHPEQSLLAVPLADGSLMCVSLVFQARGNYVEISIGGTQIFQDAIPSGSCTHLCRIPGVDPFFTFWQHGHTLKTTGVLAVTPKRSLEVQYFSGSPSASVVGITAFASSHFLGKPKLRGVFVLLDDGSIHRLDLSADFPRPQISEQALLSTIVERRRLRATKRNQSGSDSQYGVNAVPNSVGFFEKCRLVSDHITIDAPGYDADNESGYDRIAMILAGGGGDCVVSLKENEPLKFVANVENQAIVLVGARLQFGGTERSRTRVPADVKVFGRFVRWHSKNGTKRWLDIPFTVPESTASPQKVSIELLPRRSLGENRTMGDGYCAVDALELYAVSNIEFTERKLFYENERSKRYEFPRKQKESHSMNREKAHPIYIASTVDGSQQPSIFYNSEQAAVLTVLNSIDSARFASEAGSASLLLAISNLWSALFEGSTSRDPLFLDQLLKPCMSLCSSSLLSDRASEAGDKTAQMLLKATKLYAKYRGECILADGVLMHMDAIERSLFEIGGVSRSLLTAGCITNCIELEAWLECYEECMPSHREVLLLLTAYCGLAAYGRAMLRSPYGSSSNTMDVYFVFILRNVLHQEKRVDGQFSAAVQLMVAMLCSLDQKLRLTMGQRLLELFDSPVIAAKTTGSPLEPIMTTSLAKSLKGPNFGDDTSSCATDSDDSNDDVDSSPRWAYRCDNCGEVCDQEWWHCNDCEDFDLCTSCLRKPTLSCDGPHEGGHLLLRGNSGEDFSDQDDIDSNEKETSTAVLSVQKVLGPLLDDFLCQVSGDKNAELNWRFLDCAEIVVQLVGKRSLTELREARLKVLFTSSFPVVLARECEVFGSELNSCDGEEQAANFIPRNSFMLFLMLRILHYAQGRTTAVHLHSLGIPVALFSLLKQMHGHLQLLSRAVCSGVHTVHSVSDISMASWKTWNDPIAGLSYDFLPEKSSLEQSDNVVSMFQLNEELGEAGSMFLNILLLILDVLEYSYKTAASASISQQICSLPRNILCDMINFAESTFVRLHDCSLLKECILGATRVLSALSFENSDTLNDIIDKHRYEEQSTRLKRLTEDHIVSSETSLDYEISVEIASIMSNLHTATARHPKTWRRFAIQNEIVLRHLCEVARAFEGQIRVHALQLMAAGLAVSSEMASKVVEGLTLINLEQQAPGVDLSSPEIGDEASVRERTKGLSELVEAVRENEQVCLSVYQDEDLHLFDLLVHGVMLKSQAKAARIAASHLLMFGILRAVKGIVNERFITSIHGTLMSGIEMMPYAGELADGFMDCLQFFVSCCQADLFGTQSEPLLTRMALSITTSLRQRCELMVSHPNARLYGRLSSSLDIRGYFLESDPCMSCSASMCESSEKRESRIDTIRAETKYTDCSIMHRLISIHEISAISVRIIDPRRSRRAKSIDILYSPRSVTDAAELKSPEHPWRKLKSLELGLSATEASVDLIVPVSAANIKLEFTEFHILTDVGTALRESQDGESASASATSPRRSNPSNSVNENLQCPRCSRPVTDRHGICRNCHENAYQCRQCRNINYENLDGFLCNECGYCKHARFEFAVTGRPTFVAERILNEEDRRRASKIIEKETGNVHRCIEQLTKLRSSIIRSLNSGAPTEEVKERTRIFTSGRVGLADILDPVAPRAEIAVLEALLEQGQAPQEFEERANSTQGGISVTEEVIAESSGSADPNDRDQSNPSGSPLASPVTRSSRLDQSKAGNSHGNVISKSTTSLAATYSKECRSIYATMSRGTRILTMTRTELVRYANRVGGKRLQYANDIVSEDISNRDDAEYSSLAGKDGHQVFAAKNKVACYSCTQSFISKCVRIVQTILRQDGPVTLAIQSSDLAKNIMLVCSLCEKSEVRKNIRDLITCLVNDNLHATQLICKELARKIEFCIDSFETVDSHSVARFEMAILEATAVLDDSCWEERLKLVIRILFKSSKNALTCSSVAESIILPCLRVALRLMRADSELTVIENTSLMEGGSATDVASHEGLHLQASETSETENDELDGSASVALLRSIRDGDVPLNERSDTPGDHPRRSEIFEENIPVGALGSVSFLGNTLNVSAEAQPFAVVRDNARLEERRNVPRFGSDFMSGSGAPSSIGTAVDAHLSDDEVNPSTHRSESGIDIREINNMLESDHDSRLLTADVDRWLEGKLDQASWFAEMKERSIECERKEKGVTLPDLATEQPCLKLCFQRWRYIDRGHADLSQSPLHNLNQQYCKRLSIEKDNWIVRLMLFTPCTTVRKEACTLLELICGQEESLQLQLLDVLTGPALSLGADVGEKSKEFFDLLETTLSSPSHRLYLIAKGFLPRLASLIRTRAERLIMSEANAESSLRLVNFLEGYSLKRLLSLLRQTLEAIPSQRESLRERLFKVDNYKLVWSLQRAYVCVRKLISLRTRLTDECGSHLCEVLLARDFLFMGPTVTAVVSACVSELRAAKTRNDAQAIAILLEQLCLMLCPERKEPVYYLSLNKAPTQEEFIRGSMSRNPYASSSFEGPLMRDVKNKICKDLDLPGLLEDDFAMELIVAGNLVKLDLPIMGVYDHVWRESAAASLVSNMQPTQVSRTNGLRRTSHASARGSGGSSRAGNIRSTILTFRRLNSERDSSDEDGRADSRTDPPMVVVYRLSGLDGEATEPIVDSVPVENNEVQDAEELYSDTVLFGEVGGLEVLFELLTIVGSWGDDAETAVRAPALRLLRASCEVARNRTLLAKSQDAVRTLLDCAASAFEHAQGSPTAVISAESLLIAAEQILAQQRKELETHSSNMPDTVSLPPHDPEEVISRIQVFLGRLSIATSPKAENSILHLLPFLIQGVPGAITVVLEYFRFSWDAIDLCANEQRKVRQLGTVLLATPHDLRGDKFAEQTIRAEVGQKAVNYIIREFPIPRSENKEQWEASLSNPGPPLILRLITGLSLFFGSRQKQHVSCGLLRAILKEQTKIIPVLCQLEMAVSGNAIGTTTEELLEAMSKDPDIKNEIDTEREAIRKARREAAKASRMAILRETGLVHSAGDPSDNKENEGSHEAKNDEESSVLDLMRDLPDEVGPSCVVCGDGFRCRPEEALAFYAYCRRVPLDLSSGSHAALGRRMCDDNNGNGVQGHAGHVDLDVLTIGRNRNQSGSSSRSGANCCYATVTHLNAIHLSCHKEAARVDRTSRRDEWDGAFLRNSQTKCNNMFPLRPPVTCKLEIKTEDEVILKQARTSYSAAVENYFSRLSSLGRTSLAHTKVVTYDIGRGLLRFADGGTTVFSEHAKGGGPHSNACFIPSMVALSIYMLQTSGKGDNDVGSGLTDSKNLQTQEAALEKFLNEEEVGDITYYLASGIVLYPLREWKSRGAAFLRRGLNDGMLSKDVLLRLIAFTDLVNWALKGGMKCGKEEVWLDALCAHIGGSESFSQEFGDVVNKRWEMCVRKIKDEDSFLETLRGNANVCEGSDAGESSQDEEEKKYLEVLSNRERKNT